MKETDKPKYCFQCASLIYRFALILFSDVFPFLKSQIICSTLLKVQKFRYFVHLPLPSTGGWACASTRGPQAYILKAKKFAEPLFQSKKFAEKVRKSGRHFWAIWGNFWAILDHFGLF